MMPRDGLPQVSGIKDFAADATGHMSHGLSLVPIQMSHFGRSLADAQFWRDTG
jgi:hypothetical protein